MKWITPLILLTLFSCGKISSKKSSFIKQDVAAIYSSAQIKINVYYEPDAAPYVGGALGYSYWDLLTKNLQSLFQGKSQTPSISVPKTLNEMTELKSLNKTTWGLEEVQKMAKEKISNDPSGTTTFHIFFLKGLAEESSGIIGFHINGTKIIAIFKDVIRASAQNENGIVAKYVEQATIIHELGHALGLVNNGLPMKSAHQDKEHGAHCNNPNCVMYYANEGMNSMLNFAQKISNDLTVNMFDQQCLNDAHDYQK